MLTVRKKDKKGLYEIRMLADEMSYQMIVSAIQKRKAYSPSGSKSEADEANVLAVICMSWAAAVDEYIDKKLKTKYKDLKLEEIERLKECRAISVSPELPPLP